MRNAEMGFNPELSALPQNPAEYAGDMTPSPESRDQRVEIGGRLAKLFDAMEQGN